MSNNLSLKLFLSYHKPTTLLKNEIFTPIHVGRELANNNPNLKWMMDNMIGDNTGDNISSKNPNYCELTAQYWAWKNYECDYIGFMHYRRHLHFLIDKHYAENKWGLSEDNLLNQFYIEKYGLDEENLRNVISQYDILTVNPWDVKNAGSKNNYDHYKSSDSKLHIEDYDKALNFLKEKYPQYTEDIETYNNSEYGYYTNIFVMKKEIFNDYCSWLFDILFEVEKQTDISNYDFQEARIYGYISEWLFGIYITHLKRTTNLKIQELQRTVVYDCDVVQNNDNINICFSTDNNYAMHCGAAIASVLKNTKTEKTIDFYILNDGSLSKKNKKKLKKVSVLKRIVNLYFLTVDKNIFENFFIKEKSHFTLATYYRYVIPSMLQSLSKLIYLDCDLIVNSDIEELYNIDLEENYIGAVQDIIGRENQLRLVLNMSNYYCNAGVLFMNLAKMREDNIQAKLIKCTEDKKDVILWQDQDVINIVLEGKIKYLDLAWNLQYFYPGEYMDFDVEQFEQAKKNPKIIHFIGHIKPWNILSSRPFEKEYFKYLKMTPWKNFCIKHSILSFLKSLFCIKNTTGYKYIYILGFKIRKKRNVNLLINQITKMQNHLVLQDVKIEKLQKELMK